MDQKQSSIGDDIDDFLLYIRSGAYILSRIYVYIK